MNNLNEFNRTVSHYIGAKKQRVESGNKIIIDHRPDALVGEMLLTKPRTTDEQDEYVAAMIAAIAEVIDLDLAIPLEETARFLAVRIGEAIGELVAWDEEDDF